MFVTKIIMDSGKEYIVEKHYEDIEKYFVQGAGVIKNFLIYLDKDKGIRINPSHISSIEDISDK